MWRANCNKLESRETLFFYFCGALLSAPNSGVNHYSLGLGEGVDERIYSVDLTSLFDQRCSLWGGLRNCTHKHAKHLRSLTQTTSMNNTSLAKQQLCTTNCLIQNNIKKTTNQVLTALTWLPSATICRTEKRNKQKCTCTATNSTPHRNKTQREF